MEKCETRVRITTKAMRLLSLAATCLLAHGAWADYVQLPMIEADGAQLVPTDFKLESSDIIEVKFKTGSDVSFTQNIFCNRGGANKNTFTAFLLSGAPCWHYGSTNQHAQNADENVTANTIYVIKCNGATGEWWVNGVEQENPQTPETFVPGGPLAFFSSYSSGDATGTTYSGGNNYAQITFYYAKVWASGGTELKHHFVPAYDTAFSDAKKKYGLLDIVPAAPVFYENKGSRVFKWVGDGNIVWTGATSTLISDSANWSGDSGSMVFVSDAVATLASDWTAALGMGNVMMSVPDINVSFDLGSANTLALTNNFYTAADDTEVQLLSGTISNTFPSWVAKGFYIGTDSSNNGYERNSFVVSNATLRTEGEIRVGNGGASYNKFVAKDGATVSVQEFAVGINGSTNNTIEVTGAGTTFTANRRTFVGCNAQSGKPVGNKLIVSDGAVVNMKTGNGFRLGASGEDNAVEVCSGATIDVANNTVIIGSYTNFWAAYPAKNTKLTVTGSGSKFKDAKYVYVSNNGGTTEDAHEIRVLDGGSMSVTEALAFAGYGNQLVISNGSVTISKKFQTNAAVQGPVGGTNTTVRFAGTTPLLSCTSTAAADAPALDGAAIFEYVFPSEGYADAPYQTKTAITIPADFTIAIDAASANACTKNGGATIPLMKTTAASGITIADMTTLSANLPSNCELVNDSGVLSCRIKSPGLAIFVR